MSQTILSGDITVYFTNDTGGDKQIVWTGSTANTATRDVNEVYTELMDLFDNVSAGAGLYMNEGVPMEAVTPTSYIIGEIETNDDEPWFIDQETITHLTGGAITTTGWNRGSLASPTAIGIIKVPYSSNSMTNATDRGATITTNQGADSGTLLYVDSDESALWIRPDSNASGDSFNYSTGTLSSSASANTATQNATPTTGEREWVNLYTIGTLVSGTQLYVAQNQTSLTSYWPTGPFDRLFLIRDDSILLDNGYLTVYARQVNTLYDNFVSDASAGGRVAIPLATANDLNNQTAGVIAASGITVSFGGFTADVDDNTTNEDYSIQINCNNNDLDYVYEYLKYATRRGETTTTFNGLDGEQYIGIDYYITFTGGVTGTVNAGDEITGSVSGATGFVSHVNTTASPNYVTLHNSQGTFQAAENLTIGGNSINTTDTIEAITPSKQAPFGTFAGGRFFGARGVYLTNVPSGDTNNYQVITDQGVVEEEPISVNFVLDNLETDSEVRIFDESDTNFQFYNEITGTESTTSQLQTALISNPGSGYSVSDVLTLSGGSFTTAAQITVDAIDGGGGITDFTISNPGTDYTANPTNPVSTTGGGGSGATFNCTFAGSFTYSYTYTTDIPITYVVFHLNFRDVRGLGTLTNTNQTIPIAQNTDRTYSNP